MPYHIPFEKRNRPVYIGFDQPARPTRRSWNWWGFWGFVMAIGSFAVAGFASPLAFLVSANGLRKSKGPRKLAVAATGLSLAGVMLASLIVASVANEGQRHRFATLQLEQQHQVEVQRADANLQIVEARQEIQRYQKAEGVLPTGIEGNVLLVKYADPWGQSLRFEPGTGGAIVRSAGPDQEFDSSDDLVSTIKGEVQNNSRIELVHQR